MPTEAVPMGLPRTANLEVGCGTSRDSKGEGGGEIRLAFA